MELLYFFRDGTPECHVTRQTLLNYLNRRDVKFTIREINFDTEKTECEKFRVYGVPTIIIKSGNEILNRYSGLINIHELDNIFRTLRKEEKIN